ncbi:MAG: hypothetical protein U1F67_25195, partial [Rubrivivax sp.]
MNTATAQAAPAAAAAANAYPAVQLYIAGQWRAAKGGETLPVKNPATDATIGTVALARKADLDEALEAAA